MKELTKHIFQQMTYEEHVEFACLQLNGVIKYSQGTTTVLMGSLASRRLKEYIESMIKKYEPK